VKKVKSCYVISDSSSLTLETQPFITLHFFKLIETTDLFSAVFTILEESGSSLLSQFSD